MLDAVYKIFILLILFIAVFGQDNLPQSDECGKLNTDYFYNVKNLTEIGEFPWMARIQYKNITSGQLRLKCYAVLISKWFLVRGATCFTDEQVPHSVILGDWDTTNTYGKSDCDALGRCAPVPKLYYIEETIIHPNYNSATLENDIALAKLSEPVTYSDFIRPICLPSKDIVHKNFDNQLLELTGWYHNSSTHKILAKSFVRVVNLNACELEFTNYTFGRSKNLYKFSKENSICAISCFGSDLQYSINSALMGTIVVDEEPVSYYLIGMSVFRPSKCVSSKPYVYIRIDRYLDWIYENINNEISLITPRKS